MLPRHEKIKSRYVLAAFRAAILALGDAVQPATRPFSRDGMDRPPRQLIDEIHVEHYGHPVATA